MISIYIIPSRHLAAKISLLIVLLLLQFFLTRGQGPFRQRDSLIRLISSGAGNLNRIGSLNALAKYYWNINNDSAIYFADSARRLATFSENVGGEAEGNRIIGVAKLYQGKALEDIKPYLMRALTLYKASGNSKGIADNYNNLGSMWNHVNNYTASLLYYDSSLSIYKKLGDKKGEAAVLNYIGIIYQDLGEFSKAIDYTLKGLTIRKETDDHPGVVYSFLNVGNIFLAGGQTERAIKYYIEGLDYSMSQRVTPPVMAYNMLGKAYLQSGDLRKAEEYLLPVKTNSVNKYPDNLLVARLFLAKGNLDSAEHYFKKVISETFLRTKDDRQAQSMAGLSRILKMKGDIPGAIEMANKSYTAAGIVNKLTTAESAGILSELYEEQGQTGKSLYFLKVQHGILDSITTRNYQNKLAYFETSADIEKVETRMKALSVQKELQERLYQQEKLLKNILIGISILIFASAFIVIRNINAQRKKMLVQNELLDEQNKQVRIAYEELKLAQAQLIQSAKMASLGELTAGIAHEIQNPLNFVNNFSEVSRELISEMKTEIEKGGNAELRSIAFDLENNLEKINHHGKRADSIVKGMLQHSRSSSGVKEPTNIKPLADEYLRLAYQGMRAKDKNFIATLETDFDKSIGQVSIIAGDIGQVLLNLYNNAFYALNERSKEGDIGYEPRLIVTTRMVPDSENSSLHHFANLLVITVTDNGNGIPEKSREKIFQPFFTTKPTGQGTGLGLSLSYDIVKAHGGEFRVESTEGKGSAFIVLLPII